VAEQLLDLAQVGAGAQELGREHVARAGLRTQYASAGEAGDASRRADLSAHSFTPGLC
jgi:hypothetical protein